MKFTKILNEVAINQLQCLSNYIRSIGIIVTYCVLAFEMKTVEKDNKTGKIQNVSESAANACYDYGAVACCIFSMKGSFKYRRRSPFSGGWEVGVRAS